MKELILTGIKEFWPQDESNAIFLGPWCFAGNHKYKFWDQENFKLAPSPWKSPHDIFKASLYIDSLIDRIIPPLSKLMNNFHKIKYSDQFWEKYTIVWLTHWLGHCYDRYKRLEHVEKVAGEKLKVKMSSCHASNFWDYMKGVTEGHYPNLLLMSDIIRNGQFKFLNTEEFNVPDYANDRKCIEKYPRTAIDYVLGKLNRFARSVKRNLENCMASSLYLGNIYGLSLIDKFYLQLSSDPLFIFKRKNNSNLLKIERDRNNFAGQILEFDVRNEFEEIIKTIVLSHIPNALLSIYSRQQNDKPRLKIWIGNDIYKSEENAFRIAEICEHGGRWISAQHGGGYGQTLYFPIGKIEYETSDGFITWGWDFKHIYSSHYYPLPSPMLSKLPKHKYKKEQIVFVSTMHPPYFYRLQSTLLPEQQLEYLVNKKRFFLKLERNILLKIRYKSYIYDYGIEEVEFVSTVLLQDQFLVKCKLTREFKNSKLVVINHMATSFLEAFVMNVPTILFWNPEHFATTPEATPYFDKLRATGILFDHPGAAAEKVNEIWGDVQGWWQQPEVQKAKDEFCYQFARTSKNWRKEWVELLKGFIKNKGVDNS